MSEKKSVVNNGVPVAFTFKPTKADALKKEEHEDMLRLLKENNELLKELVKKLDN